MKGRARKQNSTFIYICAKEEESRMHKEQEQFTQIIEVMQKIAYKKKGGIAPEPSVIDQN